MATNALEIVNSALSYIGENPITQTDFDTPPAANRAAVVAAREYAPARDEEQRLHPWVFTLVRATLAADATVPAYGFAHTVPAPAGLLRLLRVRHQVPYRAEGAVFLTDATSLDAVYIARVTTTTLFDPAFDEVLKARLAMKFCYALSGKLPTLEAMTQLYAFSLKRAEEAYALETGEGAWEENPADDTMGTIIQEAIGRIMAQPMPGAPDPIDLTAIANRLYGNARDELQRNHPWRFTRARARLDATTTVTLTPSAVTGNGITLTASGAVWLAEHVGLRVMAHDGGLARITTFSSTTVVVANVEEDFIDTAAIAAGDWHLAPAWRWTYRYAKPEGFLRLLETQDTFDTSNTVGARGFPTAIQPTMEPVVLEGAVLVSDTGPVLNIEYVQRVSDPARWEPSFASALAAFLAWRMALPATKGNVQIEQILSRQFIAQMKAVRTADKLDTAVPPIRHSPLTVVRW